MERQPKTCEYARLTTFGLDVRAQPQGLEPGHDIASKIVRVAHNNKLLVGNLDHSVLVEIEGGIGGLDIFPAESRPYPLRCWGGTETEKWTTGQKRAPSWAHYGTIALFTARSEPGNRPR